MENVGMEFVVQTFGELYYFRVGEEMFKAE